MKKLVPFILLISQAFCTDVVEVPTPVEPYDLYDSYEPVPPVGPNDFYKLSNKYDLSFGGSMWAVGSAPIKNHYNNLTEESFNVERKVGKVNGSFVAERLEVNTTFMYNTQFEQEESIPKAVATFKLGSIQKFDFFVQGGVSDDATGNGVSSRTPLSRGSGVAPFSYNDNGFSEQIGPPHIQARTQYNFNNGDKLISAINYSDSEQESFYVVQKKNMHYRLHYIHDKDSFFYTYTRMDQELKLARFIPRPPFYEKYKKHVDVNIHTFSYDTFIGLNRLTVETVYMDPYKIFIYDTTVNYPISEKLKGTVAGHWNSADFEIGTGRNFQLLKGFTYMFTHRLSVTADASYIHGILPLMMNGQAILKSQQTELNKDWGLANITVQLDF